MCQLFTACLLSWIYPTISAYSFFYIDQSIFNGLRNESWSSGCYNNDDDKEICGVSTTNKLVIQSIRKVNQVIGCIHFRVRCYLLCVFFGKMVKSVCQSNLKSIPRKLLYFIRNIFSSKICDWKLPSLFFIFSALFGILRQTAAQITHLCLVPEKIAF